MECSSLDLIVCLYVRWTSVDFVGSCQLFITFQLGFSGDAHLEPTNKQD